MGSQTPFDRLIEAVDRWAQERGRDDVVAQIGDGDYTPVAMAAVRRLAPAEFERHVAEADAVVAHAGMGSILTALGHGTPILVMPRHGALRETRNDHQIATAARFASQGTVAVAFDETELSAKLDELDALRGGSPISPWASDALIGTVRDFIEG